MLNSIHKTLILRQQLRRRPYLLLASAELCEHIYFNFLHEDCITRISTSKAAAAQSHPQLGMDLLGTVFGWVKGILRYFSK